MFRNHARWMWLFVICGSTLAARAQTNHFITSPGSAYSVDGSPATNPSFPLFAGTTNTLTINTTPGAFGHPVVITTNNLSVGARFTNAAPQNISSGTITLKVPANFVGPLYYMCTVHGFWGQIDIVAPQGPIPPPNQIVSIKVTANVVITSTGTNTTWTLVPEYSSNLVSGLWAPVPNFSNTFANGTNTTTFDRLDPICGPNVFLRLNQQKN